MILATAGHIDHGKTALIRALTGVDPDRLPEEKRRGLTIDLGFAYSTLPDGTELGFVDVPGHERFLPNMLAAALLVPRVLLGVSADDRPRPHTLGHLHILQVIGGPPVTPVITKIHPLGPTPAGAAAAAGERWAVMVAGSFPGGGAPRRGDWILAADGHAPAKRLDLSLRASRFAEAPLRDGLPVHLHLGAPDTVGRVAVLGARAMAPGESGFVQI